MATVAIPIHRIERRMRGGSQALLVRDRAGNAYVAKCVGNPQGTRTLINEWIISRLLKHLRISTPNVHAIRIERGMTGDELLEFRVGSHKIPIAPGVHLGSACPVDPERKAIFDFLPSRLLHKVANLPDLLLAFAFDKWVNQEDTRQAIFIRERSSNPDVTFRTYLIDNGLSFGGSRWEMWNGGTLSGLYHDRSIYADPRLERECYALVERIQELPEEVFFSIQEEIPPEWLKPADREDMTRLLELLSERRSKLQVTIERALTQLHQAGGIIPKAPEAKALLGALLLAACLSRSVPPTSTTARIEVTATRNAHLAREVRRGHLRLEASFDFKSGPEGASHTYGVQVWRKNEASHPAEKDAATAVPEYAYFFRIFSRNERQARDQLLGEYAFLVRN